jgi:hypothetical protein
MKRLQDFTELEPIFRGVGITPNWLHALAVGKTKTYDSYGIVNYYIEDGICMINSGTINNGRFTSSMLKDMIRINRHYEKCIIYSERHEIAKYMSSRYGYIHDKDNNLYIKGF